MTHTLAALKEDGWRKLRTDDFSNALGEIVFRTDVGHLVVGLLAQGTILNDTVRTVHGGAMMTFADVAFGFAASKAAQSGRCVTVQMQYQFAGASKAGEFITCAPEVTRKTSQLIFMRGLILSDGRTVGSVDAIFKDLDPGKFEHIRAK